MKKVWTLLQRLWGLLIIVAFFTFVFVPWVTVHQLIRIPYLTIYYLLLMYDRFEAADTLRRKFRAVEARWGASDNY